VVSLYATESLPQPVVVGGVVFNDVAARTLVVRLSETASGYQSLIYQQAWQALRQAEESGRGGQTVWAHSPDALQVAFATPGDYGTLLFHFPTGSGSAYQQLVSRPGLTASMGLNRSTNRFISVTFKHRREL
jgi:hypothetical protein